jgi:hypothetical protein
MARRDHLFSYSARKFSGEFGRAFYDLALCRGHKVNPCDVRGGTHVMLEDAATLGFRRLLSKPSLFSISSYP